MVHRAKGEGCIAKRSDGRYQSSIQVDGYRKTFYGRTEREVKDKLKYYQAQTIMGLTERESSYTVDQYVNWWLNNVKKIELKPSSYDRLIRTYEQYLKAPIGKRKINNLRSNELQELVNIYTSKYSFSTVKKIHGFLKACLSYAVKIRDLSYNPMDAVVMPRESACGKKTKEISIPSEEEWNKFIAESTKRYAKNGSFIYNQTYVDTYVLISNTGLRIGEALALSRGKIDLERGEIQVDGSVSEVISREKGSEGHYKRIITEPKTANGKRVLALNKAAIEAIKRIQERNESIADSEEKENFLILNSKGKPASCHDLQRTLQKICKKAGINPFGLHALRHYFASKFLAHGGDAVILSKYLGHANPTITLRIYAHLTRKHNDELKRVIELI
ncbi:MAG: site-specific integrase [Lachnospiraceae bacterium]|nr:site-specific integrase [Lachnospiraceae bacterium]